IDLAASTRVGAHCRTGDRTADGRDVVASAAADLMSQHTADDAADDGARNVRSTAAVIDDLLPFHPAALLSSTYYRPDRRHVRLVDALVRTPAVFIVGLRHRRLDRLRSHRARYGARR